MAEVLSLTVGGRVIRSTLEHPFYVRDRGWTAAQELQPGDELSTSTGEWIAVDTLHRDRQPTTVYNFTVDTWHTYFLGTPTWGFDVWVHNNHGTAASTVAKSASERLPRLKGKSEVHIRKILDDAGYKRTKVSNSLARNETWTHPDGSEVRIHPYGNAKQAPFRSANNAHIHKQDALGNQLNDRGLPSTIAADTHIGIPNPPDLPIIRRRPHGAGTL